MENTSGLLLGPARGRRWSPGCRDPQRGPQASKAPRAQVCPPWGVHGRSARRRGQGPTRGTKYMGPRRADRAQERWHTMGDVAPGPRHVGGEKHHGGDVAPATRQMREGDPPWTACRGGARHVGEGTHHGGRGTGDGAMAEGMRHRRRRRERRAGGHGAGDTARRPRPGQDPPPPGRGRTLDTPLMLMSAESRSAGPDRRAGLNHRGGREGRGAASGGEQRKAAAAAYRPGRYTGRGGKSRVPLVLGARPGVGAGNRGREEGEASESPPAARAW